MHSSRVPKKTGLALGSGAARGWAHIGVIETLLERGHEITHVAGTSMGALVGSVFSSGKIDVLAKVARHLDWQQVLYHFFEVSFPRSGLLDGTKIEEFVRRHVQASDIQDLPVPFRVLATDLLTGSEVVIDRGDVIEAVRASIATPGIFTPVNRAGRVLVDGGLVNPVPVNAVREMGPDFVVAVDVSHLKSGKQPPAHRPLPLSDFALPKPESSKDIAGNILWKMRRGIAKLDRSARAYTRNMMSRENDLPNIFDVVGNSLRIIEAQIAETRLKIEPPDLLIRPLVGHLGFTDFHRAEEAIAEGRRAAEAALDKMTKV